VADGADWHGRLADAEHRRADETRAGAAEEPMDRMGVAWTGPDADRCLEWVRAPLASSQWRLGAVGCRRLL